MYVLFVKFLEIKVYTPNIRDIKPEPSTTFLYTYMYKQRINIDLNTYNLRISNEYETFSYVCECMSTYANPV